MSDTRPPRAAQPVSTYSPLPATPGAARIFLGAHVVAVATGVAGTVDVVVEGTPFGALSLTAADVTRWCAETSVLMEVTLEASVGDEVRIRTPMLVSSGGFCLALVRQDTSSGPSFAVAAAASTSAMMREEHAIALRATPDELRMLLMALESAASAATMSRGARR